MMVHDKHAWEFQVWSCCCCGCCRGQPCIHQVSVTTWFMIHMTYDLDHIVRTICCVLLFLGDWQFSRNVLNFSHSVANNNISREMITLVHNAVRYIYTHLVQLLWGNFHYIDGTIITKYSSAPLTQSDYHFINPQWHIWAIVPCAKFWGRPPHKSRIVAVCEGERSKFWSSFFPPSSASSLSSPFLIR